MNEISFPMRFESISKGSSSLSSTSPTTWFDESAQAVLYCWILQLAAHLQALPLAWVAPLDDQTLCLPHEPVPSEEWASFLRTGSAAAGPQQGYEGTGWDPGWEHSTGAYDYNEQVNK